MRDSRYQNLPPLANTGKHTEKDQVRSRNRNGDVSQEQRTLRLHDTKRSGGEEEGKKRNTWLKRGSKSNLQDNVRTRKKRYPSMAVNPKSIRSTVHNNIVRSLPPQKGLRLPMSGVICFTTCNTGKSMWGNRQTLMCKGQGIPQWVTQTPNVHSRSNSRSAVNCGEVPKSIGRANT